VQARTLELYRQLELADAVVAKGHRVPAVNLWVKGERKAHVSLTDMGTGLTPYPFLHIFPQDEHEKLLVAKLESLGVSVERRTELVSFVETASGVTARLRGPDGTESEHEAIYLAGCDGARSKVRESIGTGFPGGTYEHLFYVADAEATGPAIDGELHIDLDEADFVAVFPLAGQGRARLIGTVRDERADRAETLTFADISDRAIGQMKLAVTKINWFSTYHVHHRVAQHFRKGRAFLIGDAAHIHSPAGGQGMNTGIGDAINLAWKLAAVVRGAHRIRCSTAMRPSASALREDLSRAPTAPSPCHRPGPARGLCAHPPRADRDAVAVQFRGRAALRVSHGVADHDQLSRQPA